jgi:hypothetical protein
MSAPQSRNQREPERFLLPALKNRDLGSGTRNVFEKTIKMFQCPILQEFSQVFFRQLLII